MEISRKPAEPMRAVSWNRAGVVVLLALTAAVAYALTLQEDGRLPRADGIHDAPSPWAVIPFAGLLLSIAMLPVLGSTKQWWHSNTNKLTLALSFGAVAIAYHLRADGRAETIAILQEALLAEYAPFIVLLFSLYVISGGICLRGNLAAHPGTNTAFLAVGALIASFVGTTGASMLLIRPLLQTNSERKQVKHTVIFFIFLDSNIGGCLLPIGDPPLFLGFLRGVPFLWTAGLWFPWLVTCAGLLVIYFVWDSLAYRKERPIDIARDETVQTKLVLTGRLNLVWLLGVVLCVALVSPERDLPWLGIRPFPFMRELLMLGLVLLSLRGTAAQVRRENRFNYHAILEVAALFIGIFICMQAPIEILRSNGHSMVNLLSSPLRMFWATGALSSFLDNAPTYVVFFEIAVTMTPCDASAAVVSLGEGDTILVNLLTGISLGAVFMGAMTYIGNGPNFMVKSIAEQAGIRMPSFFGYMLYSGGILAPLFVVVTWVLL